MRRIVLATLLGVMIAPGGVLAERVVAPTDALPAGFVEIGTVAGAQDRELRLSEEEGPVRMDGRDLYVGLRVRGWVHRFASVAVEQDVSFGRSASRNGEPVELVATQGRRDMRVELELGVSWGRGRAGVTASADLPTGVRGITGGRANYSVGAFGTFQVAPTSGLFASLRWESHDDGATHLQAGDSFFATLGFHQRWGRLSLVPSGLWSRNQGPQVPGVEPYRTYRGRLLVGYEPVESLVGVLSLEYATAEEHLIGMGVRASATEAVVALGATYAWDARPLARHRDLPPPAAIRVTTRFDNPAADAVDRALRMDVPALRQATLSAERDSGGARGRIDVTLTLHANGQVASVVVRDETGSPALAAAVAAHYRRISLPPILETVTFTLTFH